MAWVRFNRKFRWRLPGKGKGMAFVEFKPDRAYSVKAQCAADAIAAGAAVAHPAPRRGETLPDTPDGAGA